jgi:HEAT repeat protein
VAQLGDARGFQTIARVLGDRPSSHTGEHDASPMRRAIGTDRYYAARLLGVLKDRRAVPLLIPLLQDREVRSVVPWSLAQIGDPRAIGSLLEVLDRDDPFMRVLAIFALETLKAPQALPKLRELLHDNRKTHAGEPITVAEAARRAINRIERDR